ncbi:hypothetical protein SRHO_G00226790 [Serrasalmus rhombeus]
MKGSFFRRVERVVFADEFHIRSVLWKRWSALCCGRTEILARLQLIPWCTTKQDDNNGLSGLLAARLVDEFFQHLHLQHPHLGFGTAFLES